MVFRASIAFYAKKFAQYANKLTYKLILALYRIYLIIFANSPNVRVLQKVFTFGSNQKKSILL